MKAVIMRGSFPMLSFLLFVRLTTALQDASNTHIDIKFGPDKVSMTMEESRNIPYTISINKTALSKEILEKAQELVIEFKPVTLSPQFDIIEYLETNSTRPLIISLKPEQFINRNYNSSINLRATYIGHATIESQAYLLIKEEDEFVRKPLTTLSSKNRLNITIVRHEGVLDKIFMYSVITFITISYINLGAQIDIDNVKRLLKKPKIILLGYLVGTTVMPLASWIAGHIFFRDQPMYRIGSFIYACGPAASASVLWTVMFDADKELALGLQIASTIGALNTMPIFLYAMDKSIDLEGQYTIRVPYMNLARTLVVLLVALMIGFFLVRYSDTAKRISRKVFRPLTMFVLLFIIVFSSIVYWYIYRMFDWTITIMALIVTSATYLLSGLLGYLLNRDIDQMITISISSTYRNSGIAFAALVVAFDPPDIFIAYVPCLTQVVTTSLIGLVLYSVKSMRSPNKRL